MTGKKSLIGLFLLFFSLSACEGTEPSNDLNTPMGLECTDTVTENWLGTSGSNTTPCVASGVTLKIRFYAQNDTSFLTGYNVYVSTTDSTWASMQARVSSHFNDLNNINGNYIVPLGNTSTNPTIPDSDSAVSAVSADLNSKVVLISKDLDISSVSAGTYYVAITAIDTGHTVESAASNIVKVTVP